MKRKIYYEEISTPLGVMTAGVTPNGLALFEFPVENRIAEHKKKLAENYDHVSEPFSDVLNSVKLQIAEYFDGKRTSFDLPLDLVGSDFQRNVWQSLLTVPYGKTMSYLELAALVGNKDSVRAVAQANGQNRIPIIVPCHRIIGSDGKLTGYSGGISRKETLLSLERGQNRLIF